MLKQVSRRVSPCPPQVKASHRVSVQIRPTLNIPLTLFSPLIYPLRSVCWVAICISSIEIGVSVASGKLHSYSTTSSYCPACNGTRKMRGVSEPGTTSPLPGSIQDIGKKLNLVDKHKNRNRANRQCSGLLYDYTLLEEPLLGQSIVPGKSIVSEYPLWSIRIPWSINSTWEINST